MRWCRSLAVFQSLGVGSSSRRPASPLRKPGRRAAGCAVGSRLLRSSALDLLDVGSALISPTVVTCAVLDAPQAERAGDVAILVEGDRADDAFILDRLAFLDEASALANSSLPAWIGSPPAATTSGIASLMAAASRLAGLGDGQRRRWRRRRRSGRRPGASARCRRRTPRSSPLKYSVEAVVVVPDEVPKASSRYCAPTVGDEVGASSCRR